MDKRIEELLNHDVLGSMEKTVGKHWSEFSDVENKMSLFSAINFNETKQEALEESNDTYFGMSWEYYLSLLRRMGFELIYKDEYEYSNFGSPRKELATLHCNIKDELFVWSTSYSGISTVNSTKVYGYFSGDREFVSGSNGWCDKSDCFYFDFDGREGLVHKLMKMKENGRITTGKWSDRFLWFLNLEDKKNGNDYKQFASNVIEQLEEKYRDILTA